MAQIPSVGRVMHYVSYGTPGGEYTSQCRAAIVTEVKDEASEAGDCVGLAVLNPDWDVLQPARLPGRGC